LNPWVSGQKEHMFTILIATPEDIAQTKLDEVKNEIGNQISSIMNWKFPPMPEKIICGECDYRVICPFKKFMKL
jgi:hypothetical protein